MLRAVQDHLSALWVHSTILYQVLRQLSARTSRCVGFQLAVAEGKAIYGEKSVPFLVLFSEIQHGCMTLTYNWNFTATLLPELYPQKRNYAILLDCKVLRTITALEIIAVAG